MAWVSGRSVACRAASVVALVAGTLGLTVSMARAATPSAGFHLLPPARLVDTRPGTSTVDGQSAGGGITRGLTVSVGGRGGVPNNATRAALRVTVTGALAVTDVYVYPCGAFDPSGTVLLRGVPGVDESQLALAPLAAGAVCMTTTEPTHVVVDVEGYEGPAADGAAYVDVPDEVLAEGTIVGPGGAVPISVRTSGAVPVGAVAVSGTLTVRTSTPGFVTVYACDGARPLAATEETGQGRSEVTTAVVAPLSANGQVCVYAGVSQASIDFVVRGYWLAGATPTAAGPVTLGFRPVRAPGLVAVTPRRLFDTREGFGAVHGGGVYDLDLTAVVPAAATDVVLNVTVTQPAGAGYVTVFPCDADRPTASSLNFVAGQTVPNLVTVSLGDTAHVCFFASVTTHLLADLSGWYELGGGSGLVPIAPSRLFDTRSGAQPRGGSVFELALDDRVPPDATAVVMNVTATEATAAGYVTVYPCTAGRPTASNLNVTAGVTAPNLVTVALGTDRRICFFTSVPTHLLADLAGSYTTSSKVGFVGVVPERLFDTRLDPGTRLAASGTASVTFGPSISTSPDLVVALVLNVTVADPVGPGYVTAYPCGVERPTASNLNFVAGQVVPNLTVVAVDAADRACFYANQATHLLADLAGYFTELPALVPVVST